MTTTQRPTFTQRGGDGAGFVYLLASGGVAPPSLNFDFTSGVLPGAITFTRPSIGTYNSSGNVLVTAGNNVARFNVARGSYCLLIEPAATNLLLQSNGFSNAAWGLNNGVIVTAAQFISPDGTNDGWSLNSVGNFGYINQGSLSFSNIPYVMSVWANLIAGVAPINLLVSFSVNPFAISSTLARVSSVTTPASGGGSAGIQVRDPDPGNTFGIFGAQLETGSTPTSYISTTTAAVTRAADSAVFTVPAGVGHLLYTFDDNSTQSVTVSPGSYTIPVTLNRPNIKSIVGSA